jgi:16S rRNA (uracil1498-N3)-methyltransferase
MKLHRFFIDPKYISEEKIAINEEKLVHQMANVLKFDEGERLILLDNSGFEYLCEMEGVAKKEILCKMIERRKNLNEPHVKIRLYQSLIKKDGMENVVEKGVEVGISEFVPILAEHSEKKGLNMERMEKIIKEAAEQSERGILPKIFEPIAFEEAISGLKKNSVVFLEKEGESLNYLLEEMHGQKEINLFVGPEGGWSDKEMEIAKKMGVKIVSLGLLTLKSETVGIVAAGVLLSGI